MTEKELEALVKGLKGHVETLRRVLNKHSDTVETLQDESKVIQQVVSCLLRYQRRK